MVGFELLAQPQRDLTAEMAAAKLMAVDDEEHYTKGLWLGIFYKCSSRNKQ